MKFISYLITVTYGTFTVFMRCLTLSTSYNRQLCITSKKNILIFNRQIQYAFFHGEWGFKDVIVNTFWWIRHFTIPWLPKWNVAVCSFWLFLTHEYQAVLYNIYLYFLRHFFALQGRYYDMNYPFSDLLIFFWTVSIFLHKVLI